MPRALGHGCTQVVFGNYKSQIAEGREREARAYGLQMQRSITVLGDTTGP